VRFTVRLVALLYLPKNWKDMSKEEKNTTPGKSIRTSGNNKCQVNSCLVKTMPTLWKSQWSQRPLKILQVRGGRRTLTN
jgi:hypothetical protein